MPFFGTTSKLIDMRASGETAAGEIVPVNVRCGVERETTRGSARGTGGGVADGVAADGVAADGGARGRRGR